MDCFTNGLSIDAIRMNWLRLNELLTDVGFAVPTRVIDGVRNFKDGAADLLLEDLYRHFTGRKISKVKPRYRVDFSDHAYQVYAAPVKTA